MEKFKIIFLVAWPITSFEAKRYGFACLNRQGLNVEVYDLSLLLNKKALLKHCPEPVKEGVITHKISSYEELDDRVKDAAGNSIFINYLGYVDIELKTEKIFRVIKKYNARYYNVFDLVLPRPTIPRKSTYFINIILSKIKKAVNPKFLISYLAKKIIFLLVRYSQLYPLPYKVFAVNADILERYNSSFGIPSERLVRIHSYDYDTYLEYTCIADKSPEREDYCVFLDEGAVNHPDFSILGVKPLDQLKYYRIMNRVFDIIEQKTGLEVVIASHPRINYEESPDVFGGRKIIKNKTVELVAKSSLVVMHCSTAVNFAVLFKKPIIFVKTLDMQGKNISYLTDTIAGALGLKAIYAEDKEVLNNAISDYNSWSNEKYEAYKYKFIKSENVEDLGVWEIVAGEIKKDAI